MGLKKYNRSFMKNLDIIDFRLLGVLLFTLANNLQRLRKAMLYRIKKVRNGATGFYVLVDCSLNVQKLEPQPESRRPQLSNGGQFLAIKNCL